MSIQKSLCKLSHVQRTPPIYYWLHPSCERAPYGRTGFFFVLSTFVESVNMFRRDLEVESVIGTRRVGVAMVSLVMPLCMSQTGVPVDLFRSWTVVVPFVISVATSVMSPPVATRIPFKSTTSPALSVSAWPMR